MSNPKPPMREPTLHPIQSFLDDAIARRAFPGAAWGVAQNGIIRAQGAAGRHTYSPQSPPITPQTLYDIASVSKVAATTAMAMLLHQRGWLDLDQTLGDLLPGFVIAGEPGSGRHRVTPRLLLAHASGLPGYAPLFLTHRTPHALLRACLHLPLASRPGTQSEYSDIGFILLGKALELIAKEPLDRFCAREIFAPLGMTQTLYNPPPPLRPSIPPTEQDETFRHRAVQGEVHDENCWALGGISGHAGLFAPASDLLRFAESILAPIHNRPSIFKPETVRLFTTRTQLPPNSSRALGFDTPSGNPSSSGSYFGLRSAGHLGYTGTSLWIDLDRDLSVVLLTNRTWPKRDNQSIQQVRPAFHDLLLAHL